MQGNFNWWTVKKSFTLLALLSASAHAWSPCSSNVSGDCANNAQSQTQSQSAASNAQASQTSRVSVNTAPSAPGVGLGAQFIQGCGVAGQAGGSNVHGAAILGVGFTTDECYAFMEAQAFNAIGDRESACEILHTTNAAKRAEKRLGHQLPLCDASTQAVVEPTMFAPSALLAVPVEVSTPTLPNVVRKHRHVAKKCRP